MLPISAPSLSPSLTQQADRFLDLAAQGQLPRDGFEILQAVSEPEADPWKRALHLAGSHQARRAGEGRRLFFELLREGSPDQVRIRIAALIEKGHWSPPVVSRPSLKTQTPRQPLLHGIEPSSPRIKTSSPRTPSQRSPDETPHPQGILVGLWGGGQPSLVLPPSSPDISNASTRAWHPTVIPWRNDLLPYPELPFDTTSGQQDQLTAQVPREYRLRRRLVPRPEALPMHITNRLGKKTSLFPLWDRPSHPLIPRVRLGTFVDVFGGSLSVLAFFVRTGRVGPETKIIVSELNLHLFSIYQALREETEAFIQALKELDAQQGKALYDRLVKEYNRDRDLNRPQTTETAARYLYLGAACYGSVLRQDKLRGHINVNYRGGDRINFFDETNLRMMAVVLRQATLIWGHYDQFLFHMRGHPERALVYLDPPYDGQETTDEYGVPPFTATDQMAVAQIFHEMTCRGIWCAVSNADTPYVRSLFNQPHATIEVLHTRDNLATGKNGGDKKRRELLIHNYSLRCP